MSETITDKLVKSLEPPEKSNRIMYDEEVKGFGIRITAADAKSFVLNYRTKTGGRERRYTIGAYPDWSVKAARDEAKRLKREVDQGRDPVGERHIDRTAPTVKDLADRYISDYLPRKSAKSRHEDAAMINAYILPSLGRTKIEDVRRSDVDAMHRRVTKRGTAIRANRTLAVLSKMMSCAIIWDWRADNPCQGVERNPENRRTRYLSQAEIARLGTALADYPGQVMANGIRLLLLTGARSGEVRTATWEQFDLDAGVWVKPSAHTKQRKEHRVPLSAPALQLLTEMRAKAGANDRYVFPSRKPDAPVTQFTAAWSWVAKAAGIEGVRVHDLRHTYASILASAGVSLPLVGALLGHTQPATTARYAHLYDDPLREATERVGAFVTTAGKPEGEVVPLRKGRR